MTDEALSQDEVDALLHGFSDQTSAQDSVALKSEFNGPSNLDLADQQQLVGKRLGSLESINERFVQLLRLELASLIRGNIVVSSPTIQVSKYRDFLLDLDTPTNLNLISLDPLQGSAVIACDPKLIFAVIDNMFGGGGKFPTLFDGRNFSTTEQRIIQRLIGVILSAYKKAWVPVYPLLPAYVRSEMYATFVDIAQPNDAVVVTNFSIKVGDMGGEAHFCIPYSRLEPLRELLDGRERKSHRDDSEDWRQTLTREIQSAEVNLVANFASIPISLGQVLQMKPGDIVQFNMPKIVSVVADGIRLFECRYGTSNGKYAVNVERVVPIHPIDRSYGGGHVH
jgi:flagellar motor switch protein FliM